MSKLVDSLVNDPNSPFSAEDTAELEQLSPELLQRVMAGMQPSEMTQEASLRAELKTCQEDILKLFAAEKDILKDLESCGIRMDSIRSQIAPVAVANQSTITEDVVEDFVFNSSSPFALMLREGLDARKQGRAKAVQTICQATKSFSAEELDKMPTGELLKWADVLRVKRPSQFETPVYNWDGAAAADRCVNQSGVNLGEPLGVLPTFTSKDK